MYSGYLDKRVAVTTIQRVFDGRGGYTNKEVTLGEFWAQLLPLSVSEQAQYQALNTNVNIKVYMRYNPDFAKGMKIKFRNKSYQVMGIINPAFEDEFMELVVQESGVPVENTPTVITNTEKVTFQGKSKDDGDESRKIIFGVTLDDE
jgi:SPP1 family predicted phage head-tail adaptor